MLISSSSLCAKTQWPTLPKCASPPANSRSTLNTFLRYASSWNRCTPKSSSTPLRQSWKSPGGTSEGAQGGGQGFPGMPRKEG
eukprot:9504080-Pyramimonas_sp.AAC.1